MTMNHTVFRQTFNIVYEYEFNNPIDKLIQSKNCANE